MGRTSSYRRGEEVAEENWCVSEKRASWENETNKDWTSLSLSLSLLSRYNRAVLSYVCLMYWSNYVRGRAGLGWAPNFFFTLTSLVPFAIQLNRMNFASAYVRLVQAFFWISRKLQLFLFRWSLFPSKAVCKKTSPSQAINSIKWTQFLPLDTS